MRRRTLLVLLVLILFITLRLPLRAQSEWMWLEGSSSSDQPGNFGTLGVSASSNNPSARNDTSMWTDRTGKHWFFGGDGILPVGGGYLNDLWRFDPSTLQWTWMGGSNTIPGDLPGRPGVYGSLGVPAAGNIPGGRYSANSWTDSNGVFWLFGGLGLDSAGNFSKLNDLWRFDPSTGQWTWMAGSNTDACSGQSSPPCGQPGVYGTQGVAAPSNFPGGRGNASNWTDANGNFWLFGGAGVDSAGNYGNLNDLWKFSPSSQQWTWITGNNLVGQTGVYGTLGVAALGNTPGGRGGATSWIDGSGNLWLFGGEGTNLGGAGFLNELWVFNPSSSEWAWMSGSNTQVGNAVNELLGVYGTLGVFSPNNVPDGRYDAAGWTDSAGNLWLFGGILFEPGYLNDVWEFKPSIQEWAWMGGSDLSVTDGTNGTYGTQGVPAATNIPGGREGAKTWTDGSGNVWLFGGSGCGAVWPDCGGPLNDLWVFGSNLKVVPSTYSLSATTVTVNPGRPRISILTVSSNSGYAGTITFTCAVTSSPSGAVDPPSCSSSGPATLSASTATATVTLQVNTTGASSSGMIWPKLPREGNGFGTVALLLLASFVGMLSRRRGSISVLGVLLLSTVVGSLVGCGGSSANGTTNPGTTPGTYTMIVTGTGNDASATKATTTFTLIVN